MAQESREWYENDSNHDVTSSSNDTPSGKFKGEEIEFESFMFDSGQGLVADLFRSGPLNETSIGASTATIKVSSGPLTATMAPPEAQSPRSPSQPLAPYMEAESAMRTDSGSLRSGTFEGVRKSQPLTRLQSGPTPSTPLHQEAEPSHFSGSIATPPAGPLRQSGPFVDGRTSVSGPTTSGSLSSSHLSSTPLSTSSTPSGQLSSTGPVGTGTGPLGQRNTGPLSQSVVDRPQSGSLTQSGQLAGNGSSHDRLSGLLSQSQAQAGQTGPLKTMNGNSGPIAEPSRFTQSGPLTPADLPPTAESMPEPTPSPTASGSLSEQSTSAPMSMSMFSQGGWSDNSLAAVEDFSSLLLAMDGARRYMTSSGLNSGMLTTSPTIRNMTAPHDSSVFYNDAAPVRHDTGTRQPDQVADAPTFEESQTVEAAAPAVAYDDVPDILDVTEAPFDPMSWIEEPATETWDAQAMMPAVDAPPADEMLSDEMSSMVADQELIEEQPFEFQPAPEAASNIYADAGPETPVDFEAPVRVPTPIEVDEGTFAGQAIEFESFMFNGGHASTPELRSKVLAGTEVVPQQAPAPQPPAPVMQATSQEAPAAGAPQEELPFWLRGTGELSMPTQIAPTVEEEAPAVEIASASQAMSDDYMDYSDLPPIDPFDFGSLGLTVEEDEGLGFNTQELSGYSITNYELMTATADLQVVADILGTDPDLETLQSEPLRPQMAPVETESVEESEAEALPTSALVEDSLDAGQPTSALDVNSTEQFDAQAPRSWTATVTSTLAADALPGAPVDQEANPPAKPGTVLLGEQASSTVTEGLGVTPFDFSDLDLDEEDEQNTELLNVPRVRNTGPLHAIAASDMPYSVPNQPHDESRPSTPQSAASSRKWATSWLGDTASQLSSFLDKPAANASAQPQQAATAPETETLKESAPQEFQPVEAAPVTLAHMEDVESEGEPVLSFMRDDSLRTGSLAIDDSDDMGAGESEYVTREEPAYNFATGDTQGEPATMWGAEQASDTYVDSVEEVPAWDGDRYPQPEQALTPTEPHTASVTTDSYPYQPMAQQPQPQYQAQPQPQPQPQAQPQMQARGNEGYGQVQPARFPTSILTSGPLPSLDGFEELQELVNRNPDDVGAHMALAAAYSQVGDTDTQLRVYRRVLRKPTVSNKILRLIAEELNDYESNLTGHPHFHQVRGDLYMKQNRYQEAIAEYNKIV